MSLVARNFRSWSVMRAANEAERDRIAFLRGAVCKNPAHLTRLVKVRVCPQSDGVSFLLEGGAVAVPGSIIEVEYHFARDMGRVGKVEFVHPQDATPRR